MATTEGSFSTMPRPRTYTRVFAVPRSTAISRPRMPVKPSGYGAGFPAGKDALERCSAILGWDVVEKSRDAEALKRTDVVQLAVFACDLAAFDVLKAEGVMTNVAAGHSLGEYAALVASGAVVLEPGLAALAARASAMEKASEDNPGAMTAIIGMSLDEAREVCGIAGRGDMLAVANEN